MEKKDTQADFNKAFLALGQDAIAASRRNRAPMIAVGHTHPSNIGPSPADVEMAQSYKKTGTNAYLSTKNRNVYRIHTDKEMDWWVQFGWRYLWATPVRTEE